MVEKKRLLILGISGLTGFKLAKMASSNFVVCGTYNSRQVDIENCESQELDIGNPQHIKNLFSEFKPDFVINTTALHNVDFCEENPDLAYKVNSSGVKLLYENCEKIGSKLLHISTDYVFDGQSITPYRENLVPSPLSIYGQSKLDGEKILDKTRHVVIRPSVVYGWTPHELTGKPSSSGKPMNFAIWLLTKLNKNESLKIVTDQFATATLADSLADSSLKIIQSDKNGLYHIAGLSCESRYDFAKKFAKEFGYDTSLITPTDSSQFKQKAKRPTFSCLDCNKAIHEFDLKLLTTEEALQFMKNDVKKEAPSLLGTNFE